MKNVLIKALSRAKEKGMSVEDSADLIIDYLEIAKDISPAKDKPAPEPPPIVVTSGRPATGVLEIGKKVDINKPVVQKRQVAWKTDELYSLISKSDLSITMRPEGWDRDLEFRHSLVKDPNGMKGVAIIWQSVDDPQFKQNYFFPVDIDQPDVEFAIGEVKASIGNTLRRRDKPIASSTVPLLSVPSDITSVAGFSAQV